MIKNIVFTLVVWSGVFLLLETGTRMYNRWSSSPETLARSTFNPSSIFVPHPFFAYALNPERADHTEQGFREEAQTVYSPEHQNIRIVALGGSSTYGTRVSGKESYPRQLERVLREQFDPATEVVNAGLGGYSTPNVISQLSLRVVPLNPQIVIFYVGFNDVWNRILFSDFQPDYSHAQKTWEIPRIPLWRRSEFLDKMADQLGSSSPKDPHLHQTAWKPQSGDPAGNWDNSSDEAFRRNLITLVSISRAHGIIPVLCTQSTDFENHPLRANSYIWKQALEEYTGVIREVAEEHDVHLIDIGSQMSNHRDYFADVLHMNEEGNLFRAELVAEYLMKNDLLGLDLPSQQDPEAMIQ